MGGLGSGRRKSGTDPDVARLDSARLELGREVMWARRRGETICKCRLEALQTVLHGALVVIAENRNLRHDLDRALARESEYLNPAPHPAADG